MEQNELNIQDIMKEIKKEIEVKGYTNDLLSFDDVIVDNRSYVNCICYPMPCPARHSASATVVQAESFR